MASLDLNHHCNMYCKAVLDKMCRNCLSVQFGYDVKTVYRHYMYSRWNSFTSELFQHQCLKCCFLGNVD